MILMKPRLAGAPSERARAFAERYFASCEAHRQEAAAVHAAIEFLSQAEQVNLNPETSIAEILESVPNDSPPGMDSLDVVEFVVTIEEECGREIPGDTDALRKWAVFGSLLGPNVNRSTWTGDTLQARSVRGVVNERVRLRGDCSCG
jgi:acyl carrier protein